MAYALKSVIADPQRTRDLIADAVGVAALGVTTLAVLWLPALLSA